MKILQGIFVFDAKFLLSRYSLNHSSEGENEIIKIICNKNVINLERYHDLVIIDSIIHPYCLK